jgi:beta-phosphoglucomutase-like phosphatase (HAD superfamily)
MLTDTETAILEMERSWWKAQGRKDEAIRVQFGMTPTRYYAALGQLLQNPEAEKYDPMTVRRLRRIRDARRSARASQLA